MAIRVLLFEWSPTSLASWLIKIVTKSKYTHAAVQIGTRYYDSSETRGSVGRRVISTLSNRTCVVLAVEPDGIVDIGSWVQSQLGRKYDWYGIFGWIFGHQNPEDVYCFEWVWELLDVASGVEPRPNSISGDDLYKRLQGRNCIFRGKVERYRDLY